MAAGGVAIYVAIDIALAFLRPDLSLIHRAESDYGVGRYSCVMDLNFLIRAGLSLAAVGAILRLEPTEGRLRLGAGLLAIWGVASGLLAFFPDNPPGTPVTTSGMVHLNLALAAFLGALVGTILLSFRLRDRPQLRPISGWLLAISLVAVLPLLLLSHSHFSPHSPGGLYERLFLGLELLWILVAGLGIHRSASSRPRTASERP